MWRGREVCRKQRRGNWALEGRAMGEVVTGKVKTGRIMQQSPGICKGIATKGEQAKEEVGNGCPLGKGGSRAGMYHIHRCSAGQSAL